MKTIKVTLLSTLIIVTLFSCKKDHNCNCGPKPSECPVTKWQGTYATFDMPDVDVTDSTFIKNGVAKLTKSPYAPVFYTRITLPVPSSMYFLGDSVTLSARVKNPENVTGSVFPYDVNLLLIGESNIAISTFIGKEINQQYNALKVGNKGVSNDPSLLYLFQDWSTIDLKAKNNILSVYRNGTLIKSINYTGIKIGALKKIQVAFKGSGTVDWVKLTGSASGNEIMHENFDEDSKSTDVWNCQAGHK